MFHALLFISLSQEINIILKLVCILSIYLLYFITCAYIHKNKMSYIIYHILLSDNSIAENCVFNIDLLKSDLLISISEFYEYVIICLLPSSCV